MGNQGEYQIKISSVADLAAVEKARAEYQRLKATLAASGGDTTGIDAQLAKLDAASVSGQAAAARALAGWQAVRAQTQAFKGDTKAIDAEIAKLQATLGGGAGSGMMAAGVQALGNAVAGLPGGSIFATMFSGGGAAVAALGAVAGAIGAVKHGLEEYAARQSAVAKLDQQLANAGRLTGEYREQIQALADTFSKVSGIDDTTWLRALGKIQSKDTTANLAQNAELLKNMAARTGDVDQAATLLSRALAGSFDRLRMYGFQIDESGSKTEKLKQLMEQAAKGGAGVFEAQLQTLTGQKQRLGTATHQLWEGVGRLAFQMGLGGGTARRLGDAIEWVTSKLPKADPVLDATTNKTDGFAKALAQATGAAKDLGEHTGDGAEGMNTTGEAADKLVEKLGKATAAINENVAATLKIQDAQLADQIAQIDAREAGLAQQQGGKLTTQQKSAFAQERIDARGVAAQRKLDLQEGAAEQEIEEIQREQQRSTAQLGAAQAKQAKADTAIVAEFAAAGVPVDGGKKPFEQAAALKAQLEAGQETLKAYQKDLADLGTERDTATKAALDGDVSAGPELVRIAGQQQALKQAIKELEDATTPLAALQLKLTDLAKESELAEAEVKKLQETAEKFYGLDQAARGKLAVIRIEKGTATTATATQTTQEQTKAAAEARAVDKANIEGQIKLNESQLKAAAPGSARQQELAEAQRRNQAKKLEIELFEEVDLQRRQQMIEQAGRDGFKVRNANTRPVVTPMTRAESLANPTVRPTQTVKPTEVAPPPAPAPQPVRTPLATRPADNAPEPEVKAYAVAENARRAAIATAQGQRTGATPGFRALPVDSAPAILAALREEDRLRAAAAPPARPAPRPRVPSSPPAPRGGDSLSPPPSPAPAPPPAPGGDKLSPPQPAPRGGDSLSPPLSPPSSPSSPSPEAEGDKLSPPQPLAPVTLPTPDAPVVNAPEQPAPVVLPAAPAAPVTLPTPDAPVVTAPELPALVVNPPAPLAPVTLPTPAAPEILPPAPSFTPNLLPAVPAPEPEPDAPQMPPEIQRGLNRERSDRYPAPPSAPTAEGGDILPPPLEAEAPPAGDKLPPPQQPSAAAVVAPRAAESAVAGGVIVAGMVADKATSTATAALATYDKAAEVITKTEQVLEKVTRLAAAPGTAGEGAAAAGKAAELGSKIAGQVAIGTEAAGAASKALAVAGAASKVAGVLKPLAPIGAVLEAGKLATDFKGETGRVEDAANKGLGPAMAEGFFAPLTTIATTIKVAAEVLALNAENARAEKKAARGGDSLSPPPTLAPVVNAPAGGDKLSPPQGPVAGGPPALPPVAGGDKLSPPQQVGPPAAVAELNGFAAAADRGTREVSAASQKAVKSAAEASAAAVAAFATLTEQNERMAAQMARMAEDFKNQNRYGAL